MRGGDGTPQSRIGWLCTACTDCGIIGWPHQAGSDCAYFGRGIYLHVGYFDLVLCPECIGKRFGCKTCYCKGVLAVPCDMTHERAERIWAKWREARSSGTLKQVPSV